jgi:hypothetical protein
LNPWRGCGHSPNSKPGEHPNRRVLFLEPAPAGRGADDPKRHRVAYRESGKSTANSAMGDKQQKTNADLPITSMVGQRENSPHRDLPVDDKWEV